MAFFKKKSTNLVLACLGICLLYSLPLSESHSVHLFSAFLCLLETCIIATILKKHNIAQSFHRQALIVQTQAGNSKG